MGGGVSSEKNQPPNISARVSPPIVSATSRSSNRSFREIQFRHASDVDGANSCQPGPSAPDKPKKMDPEWDDQPGPSGSRKSKKMEGKWEEKVTPGVMERTKSDLSEFELPQYEVGVNIQVCEIVFLLCNISNENKNGFTSIHVRKLPI